MASFRALVLGFVRDYIARWGQSPSYGEIAAGLGSNATRAKRAVRSLEKAGLIIRRPGTRGLMLPDELAQARTTLERAGLLDLDPGNDAAGLGSAAPDPGPQGRKADWPPAAARAQCETQRGPQAGGPAEIENVPNATLLPPAALDYPHPRKRRRRGRRGHGTSG